MGKVTTANMREHASDILNRAAFGKERITLTRRGKDLVAIVPLEDLELLEQLENRIDLEAAKEALKEGGAVAWTDLKAELGL